MPTVYLHVGPHKTGSTYLQDQFASQTRSLERQGILYPFIGRKGWTGHHDLAWFFAERRLRKATHGELSRGIAQLAGERRMNILFSSEVFSLLKDLHLTKLRNAFPEKKFHVLYFRRKGSALFVSLWRESVKNGFARSLDEVHRSSMAELHGYDPFEHDKNIARYEHCLEGNVSVFDYNNLLESKIDLTEPVSGILHASIKSRRQEVNPSLSVETTELIRAANLHAIQIGNHRSGRSRIICTLTLRIPFLGRQLREHLDQCFAKLGHSLSMKDLYKMGFKSADFLSDELDVSYNYIPGYKMLEELNKYDILPWRMIKMMLQNK